VDTGGILFICGGTFTGIEDIIGRRIGRSRIGFQAGSGNALEAQRDLDERDRLLAELDTKDLIEFGMIPEFVGRLPIQVHLRGLDPEDLTHILTEPKNALVKQFQAIFAMEGHELNFTDEALRSIAEKAFGCGTGVRALRSLLEEILHDLMFSLPEYGAPQRRFVITGEMVRHGNARVLLEGGEHKRRERA
jgi:ATP-dependent Clp protease ATP-binding subunit ClpX